MIYRIRHIIKTFQYVTIIFIDHVVNVSIIKQTTLLFNNINKLNFRLIQTSIYLFQFRFDIRYRFNKKHVISNVFFRLSTNKIFFNNESNLNLKSYHSDLKNFFVCDRQFAYYESLISMSSNFRQRLIDNYFKKKV